jgi:hypothetical protein
MSTAVVASQVPQVEPSSSGQLDWHIVLESLTDGQVAASIAELPDCKVIAGARDEAIAKLALLMDIRAKAIEVIPYPLKSQSVGANPWEPFYGALKDDQDFIQWANDFWAEKQRSHDDDEILSVEECLQVM